MITVLVCVAVVVILCFIIFSLMLSRDLSAYDLVDSSTDAVKSMINETEEFVRQVQ